MRGNFSIGVRGCSLADRSVIIIIRRWEPIHQFLHYGLPNPVMMSLRMMWATQYGSDDDIVANQAGTDISNTGSRISNLMHQVRLPASIPPTHTPHPLLHVTLLFCQSFQNYYQLFSTFEDLSTMFGVVTRLTDLIFRLQDLATRAGSGAQQQGSSLVVAGCDIVTPNSASGPRVLARNLSFTLSVGDPRGHLAVTGPSGCGKSALCRVVNGLWALPAGTIALPTSTGGEPAALHFVPQKLLVLTAPESLRDFVTYPTSLSEDEFAAAEADIRRDLATLKLVGLVDREGWEKRFWHERLSLGEMQSLAMARLLFHRPRLAVLGEHGHLPTNVLLSVFKPMVLCCANPQTTACRRFPTMSWRHCSSSSRSVALPAASARGACLQQLRASSAAS